jgi:hypothetical protein
MESTSGDHRFIALSTSERTDGLLDVVVQITMSNSRHGFAARVLCTSAMHAAYLIAPRRLWVVLNIDRHL